MGHAVLASSVLWSVLPPVALLGAVCGVVGTVAVLRQRALMADTLAHAGLPGVAGAFLIAGALGFDGRSLPILLTGATLSGIVGLTLAHWLTRTGRLRDEAAMAVVLSSMFGLGAVLLSVVQRTSTGGQAGLSRFLFGQTASIGSSDAVLIAAVSIVCLLACALLYKELRLLCFDRAFAAALGRPVGFLDAVTLGMITLTTVVGMQAVGLVLIVAMLVIPACAARFWSDRLWVMLIGAGLIGAVAAGAGGVASASIDHLPAGPAIVICAAAIFLASGLLAPGKGLLYRLRERLTQSRRLRVEHALRRCYEQGELNAPIPPAVVRALAGSGLLFFDAAGKAELTTIGQRRATEVVRRHRLWEQYLIQFGSHPPEHADDPADLIEHLQDPVLLDELERATLTASQAAPAVPSSPHGIDASARGLRSQRGAP